MSKQHEKLAVKPSLMGKFMTLLKEAMDTFTSKHHLFTSKMVEFTPNTEGKEAVIEEQSKLQYTVRQKFDYLRKDIVGILDLCNQINTTNTVARADVVVDGVVVLKEQNAMTLLELEKILGHVKAMVLTAPTLDPAKGFSPDNSQGEGIYKARVITKTRTQKKVDYKVVVQPTKEHPAQVKEVVEDIPIGTIRQDEWSGMLMPAEKAEILAKIEDFLNAVKEAISRANNTDVIGDKIGQPVFNHIFG